MDYEKMLAAESALVILVPEAEARVTAFRDRYDPAAAAGMPAHITLLVPFKPPDEIDATMLDVLRQCFARFAPFQFSLAATRRFPGVLYLAPEPDEPFRRLTLAIWERFAETPPYGGKHTEIVPHLTVAHVADERELDRIAEQVEQGLHGQRPIVATAAEVALMYARSGPWQIGTTLSLGNV